MATTAVQQSGGHSTSFEPITAQHQTNISTSHDVATKLNYYKESDDGTGPAPAIVGKPETYKRPHEVVDVVVHDIRGREDAYTLDGNGFQIFRHTSAEKDFVDEDQVKAIYYPETEQLLKDATGASRVFIFDHTIRRTPKAVDPKAVNLRGPVNQVHVDQSYSAAKGRVPHHLPEDAEKLLQGRYQIINVWRPIRTILKDPLGVSDGNTVAEEDLVPVGLIYPDRRGETLTVKPNPQHKWHFLYKQTPDEPLLIKCFDSKLDGRVRRIPHSAFEDPAHEEDYSRESIEVRALVFHEHESTE